MFIAAPEKSLFDRRFGRRVQRALDSGHLDPRIARDIRNLPAGALYYPKSKRSKKVKPVMYEVRLGEPRSVEFNDPEESDVEGDKIGSGISDWKRIMVCASLWVGWHMAFILWSLAVCRFERVVTGRIHPKRNSSKPTHTSIYTNTYYTE